MEVIIGKQTLCASLFLNGKEYLRTSIYETEEEVIKWATDVMEKVKQMIGDDEYKRIGYDKQELRIYR